MKRLIIQNTPKGITKKTKKQKTCNNAIMKYNFTQSVQISLYENV